MNAETVPNSTNETQVLDQTEKEYDRMISQQMMYHRVMMEDLMKLSSEKGSSFSYTSAGSGMWAGEPANEYTCANAVGHRADLGGWCIFTRENDAKNECNSDPTCLGYVSNSPDGFQLTKKPVANDVANGIFYKKIITPVDISLGDRMNTVAGLGNTIAAIDVSNRNLLQSAQGIVNKGSQNATTASNLHANIKETRASLASDVAQYAALMKQMQQMQKEGFSNPTMDAALENSAIVSESEKYALVLFGVCAIFLFYKTVKYL